MGIDDEDEMIGGDEMDLSDDESNVKKTKTKTDPIQLQVIWNYDIIMLFILKIFQIWSFIVLYDLLLIIFLIMYHNR